MGAGSTRTREKIEDLGKNIKKPCEYYCRSRRVVRGMERLYFLNTGGPYCIEECYECKRQYVREL